MTASRAGIGLSLLAGAALAVAACGSAAATAAPITQAPPTQAPPTQPPASNATPTFAMPSFSFTADAVLEAMFPKELGGETLRVVSMSGSNFLGTGSGGNEIGPILTQLGKTPADLSVAFGGTSSITVIAFRIKGIAAEQFLNAYTASAQGAQGASITDASLGGKSVKKVVTPTQTTATYIYLKGDVVWTVGGTSTTDALLNEAFSKLP